MLYSVFIFLMNFLERTFGYEGAIRIKDSADYAVGIIFGAFVALHLMGNFYLEVYRDLELSSDAAITRAAHAGYKGLVSNPRTSSEVVEVFFGYVFLKIFPEKGINFRHLRVITFIVGLIMASVFFIGVLMSLWDYLPMAGH